MSINVSVQVSEEVSMMLRESGRKAPRPADSRNAAAAACRIVGASHAMFSITWLDDAGITRMNEEYLEHEGPTDVISFHLYEHDEVPVGDIYIGFEQAARQAAAFDTTLDEELMRLAVHGVLHVLGFEHPDGEARTDSDMWSLQEAIMAEILA
jgi:probable rRNA maturation factor